MLNIRPATQADAPDHRKPGARTRRLRKAAARSQGRRAEDFLRELDSPNPVIHVLIAEWNGRARGFRAVFLQLLDLRRPAGPLPRRPVRASGAAQPTALAGRCCASWRESPCERDCGRMEWAVLDWNEPALAVLPVAGGAPDEGVDHPSPHAGRDREAGGGEASLAAGS